MKSALNNSMTFGESEVIALEPVSNRPRSERQREVLRACEGALLANLRGMPDDIRVECVTDNSVEFSLLWGSRREYITQRLCS